ncbi:uncharacterized protein LOC62_01G000233 [Vanrija pseudolonga]|uniref:HIT domain-containing protein n=1 Tax=Vanrija pseudolonga TaxID=143232 RepID=A0AAF0Y2X8_9TREE|nr:hypothetical protein LOC62_01G000233 [Vanrija pseudolonga]
MSTVTAAAPTTRMQSSTTAATADPSQSTATPATSTTNTTTPGKLQHTAYQQRQQRPRPPHHTASSTSSTSTTRSLTLTSPTANAPPPLPDNMPSSSSAAPTFQGRLTVSPQQGLQRQPSSSAPLLRTNAPVTAASAPVYQTIHPGCVLCGIVATASSQTNFTSSPPRYNSSVPTSPIDARIPLAPARAASPDIYRPGTPDILRGGAPARPTVPGSGSPTNGRSSSTQDSYVSGRHIIYRDDDITVYPADDADALCGGGRHLTIVLNRHLTSVYQFGPTDLALLSHITATASRLLLATAAKSPEAADRIFGAKDVSVGFVNGMPRDPRSPYAHLHAQAFLGPFEKSLPGSTLWRRNVVFGTLNWWAIPDLIAEIREETSNNRIKSGYENLRPNAPLSKVPDAGAAEGFPNVLNPPSYTDNTPPKVPLDKGKSISDIQDTDPYAETPTRKSKSTLDRKSSAASTITIRPPVPAAEADAWTAIDLGGSPEGSARTSLQSSTTSSNRSSLQSPTISKA